MHKLILPALFALAATAADAAPVLKSEVTISRPIVTVGDMFEDAGLLAEKGLFRAPAPGTTGIVSLETVRAAAALVGLTEYNQDNVISVRVARPATLIDAPALTALIEAELALRGLLQPGAELIARFDAETAFKAEAVDMPATARGAQTTRPAARCSPPASTLPAWTCRSMSAAGSTSWSRCRTSTPQCRPAPSSGRPMSP